MRLLRLAEHVYACEQQRAGTGWSNSGLITAGGGLVVDTLYDVRLTQQMAGLYADVMPDRPRRVVNTHHNGDHCWGNQVFAGAEIIAHRGCADRFFDFTPEAAEAIRTMPEPPERLADLQAEFRDFAFSEVTLTAPTRVIDGDLTVELDGLPVRLLHVGPAHTEGDLIVHVPDEGVVATGDILFNRCAPIGWEGSTDRWIAALRTIEELAPEHVIPGHGPICGVADVRAARSYLEDVQAFASQCWAKQLPVLDCCDKLDLGPFAGWGEPWRVAATVHRVYRECAGAAWDAAFDSGEVMSDVHALRRRWELR
jgi:glyoxylase-like metal-dependent hydrolase (beta-lactamase superfamily II)